MTRQSRFEIKYIFPLEKLDRLLAYIGPFMEFDQYIDTVSRVGSYKVSSVYLDSKNFEYYWSHLEGYPSRRKMRIRKYSHKNRNIYFWEIKSKTNFSLQKDRLKLDEEWIEKQRTCEDFSKFCEDLVDQYSHTAVANMIHFDVLDLKIRPVLNVIYSRMAYRSRYEHDVRLTLDYNIQVSKVLNFLKFEHEIIPRTILPNHAGVLELKCNGTIPRWLRDILITFRLTRTAFSKYQKGIEQVYKSPLVLN